MKKIFAKIRFYVGAFVISFITAVIMIPLVMIFRKYRSTIRHKLNRVIFFFLGGESIEEGEIDKSAQIYMINHQGIVDIIIMEATHNLNINWVAKKQLFDAFWFGYILKESEMISIDRANKRGMLKLIRDAKKSIFIQNRPVAIFPEGTRTDKQELLSFKNGAKVLAEKLKLRVQPIIITGAKKLLNEHNRTANNSIVKLKYLPSIDVDNLNPNWYKEMREDMQREINIEYNNNNRPR
ncbi:1-acyl-sn-glycerol-3-phosphate acyltransferase [hydrothermal vent metagenome]|uniref:1-acyl-sn-glycerol-3-phosphate acyltransferase n=1 Tax=hydrothermal vent metagenome TaxID=652676 RepID=A0A1W1EKJ9_9ZZZZ